MDDIPISSTVASGAALSFEELLQQQLEGVSDPSRVKPGSKQPLRQPSTKRVPPSASSVSFHQPEQRITETTPPPRHLRPALTHNSADDLELAEFEALEAQLLHEQTRGETQHPPHLSAPPLTGTSTGSSSAPEHDGAKVRAHLSTLRKKTQRGQKATVRFALPDEPEDSEKEHTTHDTRTAGERRAATCGADGDEYSMSRGLERGYAEPSQTVEGYVADGYAAHAYSKDGYTKDSYAEERKDAVGAEAEWAVEVTRGGSYDDEAHTHEGAMADDARADAWEGDEEGWGTTGTATGEVPSQSGEDQRWQHEYGYGYGNEYGYDDDVPFDGPGEAGATHEGHARADAGGKTHRDEEYGYEYGYGYGYGHTGEDATVQDQDAAYHADAGYRADAGYEAGADAWGEYGVGAADAAYGEDAGYRQDAGYDGDAGYGTRTGQATYGQAESRTAPRHGVRDEHDYGHRGAIAGGDMYGHTEVREGRERENAAFARGAGGAAGAGAAWGEEEVEGESNGRAGGRVLRDTGGAGGAVAPASPLWQRYMQPPQQQQPHQQQSQQQQQAQGRAGHGRVDHAANNAVGNNAADTSSRGSTAARGQATAPAPLAPHLRDPALPAHVRESATFLAELQALRLPPEVVRRCERLEQLIGLCVREHTQLRRVRVSASNEAKLLREDAARQRARMDAENKAREEEHRAAMRRAKAERDEAHRLSREHGLGKKEREELEVLRSEVTTLRSDAAKAQERWRGERQGLRAAVGQAQEEVRRLRDELRLSEQARLAAESKMRALEAERAKERERERERARAREEEKAREREREREREEGGEVGRGDRERATSRSRGRSLRDTLDTAVPAPATPAPTRPPPRVRSGATRASSAVRGAAQAPRAASAARTRSPSAARGRNDAQRSLAQTLPGPGSGAFGAAPARGLSQTLSGGGGELEGSGTTFATGTSGGTGASVPADAVEYAMLQGAGAGASGTQSLLPTSAVVETIEHAGGKVESRYACGARVVRFPNGARKVMWANGQSRADFPNGDWKESHPDGAVVYYYSAAHTLHTTRADGVQIYQFGNSQTETHFPDGRKEVLFSDGTVKYMSANGDATSVFPNGSKVFQSADGGPPVALG